MSAIQFVKASKTKSKLRAALIGPAGSGKTYSALAVATGLGGKIAVLDTEHGSASKYADRFDFDTLELRSFSPQNYIDAIHAAEQAGYAVLVIDSLSHAWSGKDGALEMVDRAKRASQSGNSFTAWKDVTPLQNQLIDAMIGADLHVIATMRSKTEYVIETNERGKQTPRKIGIAPIQRSEIEYEFDVIGELDIDNVLSVTKTRCPALAGQVIPKPGAQLAQVLTTWLSDGAPALPRTETTQPAPVEQWTRNPQEWATFAQTAKELGFNVETVRDILQVAKVHDYRGTREQATELLRLAHEQMKATA